MNQRRLLENETLVDFDVLISPMTRDAFMSDVFTKTYAHFDGAASCVKQIGTWSLLDQLLTHQLLSPSRIRLVKNGIHVEKDRYSTICDGVVSRLNETAVSRLLREGSMVIVNYVEDTTTALKHVAGGMERLFHSPVDGVLCANMCSDPGFNLHWDEREVFVVQLEGRKRWRIHKPTISYPVAGLEGTKQLPHDAAVFDQILEKGETLYIPRGWWHIATPLDEPSLHLSLCVKPQTGLELLKQLTFRLSSREVARVDIPACGSTEIRTAYMDALFKEIQRLWNLDLLEEYLASVDDALPRRGNLDVEPTA